MNATKLTDLELRIFIAKSIGYTQVTTYKWDDSNPSVRLPKQFHIDECGVPHNLPDYTGSRDACYEFTGRLTEDQKFELFNKCVIPVAYRDITLRDSHTTWDFAQFAFFAKPRLLCEAYYEFLSAK